MKTHEDENVIAILVYYQRNRAQRKLIKCATSHVNVLRTFRVLSYSFQTLLGLYTYIFDKALAGVVFVFPLVFI